MGEKVRGLLRIFVWSWWIVSWTGVCLAASDVRAAPEAAGTPAQAEAEKGEPRDTKSSQRPKIFDQVMVTGGAERLLRLPGSAHLISREELLQQEQSDIHRILRQLPGVNYQEEEGYGLRPNIGMRGTGVDRSQKVTLLEDGVLIAPAPYAAPAAYYFPTAARMEGIEVRKGSSSIEQGPHTTGGVLNMISTEIPGSLGGRVSAAAGEDATVRLHATVGDSGARIGWLLEGYDFRTEGFKRLDGGGDTGVTVRDYLGKFRISSDEKAKRYQAVEVKVGKTLQDGDETYLGLTSTDFQANPFRRYSASQQDRIDADHQQVQLRYFLQPTKRVDFTGTVYRNEFFRNWYKLQSVDGVGLGALLSLPDQYPNQLAALRGEVDTSSGEFSLRNNRRNYFSQGVEGVVGVSTTWGATDHRWAFGLRLHEDEEDRFQEEDSWNSVGGRLEFLARGLPGSQSNRVSDGEAAAIFIRDEIAFKKWAVTPGIRFESIRYRQRDYGKSDPSRTGVDARLSQNSVEVAIPGVGVSYLVRPAWVLFGGVHKGFSPPGPGRDASARAEESVNWEIGLRHRRGFGSFEAVAFFNDYSNLLGRDTNSSGGAGNGDLFNGGAVLIHGLELSARTDIGLVRGWKLGVPVSFSYTYTEARFDSTFETDFEDWGPRVSAGDHLPYLPQHQWNGSAGVAAGRWETFLTANYSAAMRTIPGQEAAGRESSTDSRWVMDLAGSLRVREGLKLRVQVRNLFDEVYLAALRPAGSRPGLPRSALVGVTWDF